jgi:hypothetical protein
MKICLVVVELFLADGGTNARTDMTKVTVAFHNFAKAPKNDKIKIHLTKNRGLSGLKTT